MPQLPPGHVIFYGRDCARIEWLLKIGVERANVEHGVDVVAENPSLRALLKEISAAVQEWQRNTGGIEEVPQKSESSMMPSMADMPTTEEVAAVLGIGRRAVHSAYKRGRLKAQFDCKGDLRYDAVSVADYRASRRRTA
jgi:hypothetical protein